VAPADPPVLSLLVAAFGVIFAPMIVEAILSARHERGLRARGAIEPAGDVYKVMQLAYPGGFLVLLAEAAVRGVRWDGLMAAGVAVFAAAKALKYWAIATLGDRWTFRVLVPPGSTPTRLGPYRWLRHPNYVAVAGEFVGAALATHALIGGVPVIGFFIYLMWRRVGLEETALSRR
jgi:methyltransferase